MITVDELLRKADDYANGAIPLEVFDRWFDDNTSDAYTNPEVCQVYEAVESAMAQYHFDHIGQSELRKELAAAIRPFAQSDGRSPREQHHEWVKVKAGSDSRVYHIVREHRPRAGYPKRSSEIAATAHIFVQKKPPSQGIPTNRYFQAAAGQQ